MASNAWLWLASLESPIHCAWPGQRLLVGGGMCSMELVVDWIRASRRPRARVPLPADVEE